MENNTTI